jgi:hypothetical protein
MLGAHGVFHLLLYLKNELIANVYKGGQKYINLRNSGFLIALNWVYAQEAASCLRSRLLFNVSLRMGWFYTTG